MAENTPGNLSGLFGGRATAGNRHLDSSVDKVEQTVDRLAAALARLVGSADRASRSTGGTSNGGVTAQSQSSLGNGGHAPQSHRAEGGAGGEPKWTGGGGYEGTHRENGGGARFGGLLGGGSGGSGGGGGGGAHAKGWGEQAGDQVSGMYDRAGGRVGIAKKVGVGTLAAGAVYTANHASGQITNEAIARQYSYGTDMMPAYRGMFQGNYTAVNAADVSATANILGSRSGFMAGTSGYSSQKMSVAATSLIDPTISNASAASANMALGSVGTFNKMAALGMSPSGGRGGGGDPMSIARQVLARMPGSQNVRTPQQVAAAFGPSGSATVTIRGMVDNGFIPAAAEGAVTASMRAILKAQVGGMSYSSLQSNLNAVNSNPNNETGDKARNALAGVSIGASAIASTRVKEGMSRDDEVQTVVGFTKGVKMSTEALKEFRGMLTSILKIPGVGELTGLSGGFSAGLGSVLSKIPGMGIASKLTGGIGMAAGGVLPGYTPGRDVHHFVSPTGGALDLSGGEGILIPQATKALGGEGGIKAINDRFRQSFASGGTFKNPDAKVSMDGKSISAIAAAQIRLAEQIGHVNLHIMQGGFGGSHIAASGSSHNYPGVADISPGNVSTERLLRSVGFAAWARNVPGRSRVGSGAHVHAVSLLDPGDKGSPQVYGSWAHHGNGLSGYNNDPAPHVGWIANLKERLGAVNLAGLGGGGGTGSTDITGAGAGGALGSGTGTGIATSGGGGGGGGGGSVVGYSEVAALFGGGGGGSGTPVGGTTATGDPASSALPAVSGGGSADFSGIKGGGNAAANMALGRAMAAKMGWAGQWASLKTLWSHESGWNNTAQNPTSTAYGIAQFLDSTWGSYGKKTSDPKGQIAAGLKYIKARYGDPNHAWSFWQKNNWYDEGAWNLDKDHDARVHKGEMILPAKVAEAVRGELTAPGMKGGKNTGPAIVFQSGAIVVQMSGATGSTEAKVAAKQVVDAIVADNRLKALAGGDF